MVQTLAEVETQINEYKDILNDKSSPDDKKAQAAALIPVLEERKILLLNNLKNKESA